MNLDSLRPAIGFFSVPLQGGGGFTWTLTTWLGILLHQVEQIYGPRDLNYTLLGVEFNEQGPMLWYPGNRKHVSIILSAEAAHQPNRALWQLAHETVHLLSPTQSSAALIAEEGLATLFASRVSTEYSLGFSTDRQDYREAEEAVSKWLSEFPSAISATRNLEPCMALWTAIILKEACPGISDQLAERLCERFQRL